VEEYLVGKKNISAADLQILGTKFTAIKTEYRLEAIGKDRLISAMKDLLVEWSSSAHLIYLTARELDYEGATRARIDETRIPRGQIAFKENSEERSPIYKGRRLRELVDEVKDGELVLTLDDDEKNLIQMRRTVSNALHVQVQLRQNNGHVDVSLRIYSRNIEI
jgi:uncharacterized HAD superfamily protein